MKDLIDITPFGFKFKGVQYALEERDLENQLPCTSCVCNEIMYKTSVLCHNVNSTMCKILYDDNGRAKSQLQFLKVK